MEHLGTFFWWKLIFFGWEMRGTCIGRNRMMFWCRNGPVCWIKTSMGLEAIYFNDTSIIWCRCRLWKCFPATVCFNASQQNAKYLVSWHTITGIYLVIGCKFGGEIYDPLLRLIYSPPFFEATNCHNHNQMASSLREYRNHLPKRMNQITKNGL